jgi:hypothetical protein
MAKQASNEYKELVEAARAVLFMARLKWGNLDKDANKMFNDLERLIELYDIENGE